MVGTSPELRAVSASYAILAVLFLVTAALFMNFGAPGSPESMAAPVSIYGSLAVAHALLATLIWRYRRLTVFWRCSVLAVSFILALWQVGGALREYFVPPTVSFISVASLVGMKWLLALAYCLCAYLLWKAQRASNQSLERP